MKSRMKHPAFVVPEALKSLQELNAAVEGTGLPKATMELVHLRVSQINGCSICVDMHKKELNERVLAVSAWRDTPYFDDAERAALALAESLTRIADRAEGVPDDVWNEATRHFDERALSGLIFAIAQTNVFNRLNVAVKQMVGDVKWSG